MAQKTSALTDLYIQTRVRENWLESTRLRSHSVCRDPSLYIHIQIHTQKLILQVFNSLEYTPISYSLKSYVE